MVLLFNKKLLRFFKIWPQIKSGQCRLQVEKLWTFGKQRLKNGLSNTTQNNNNFFHQLRNFINLNHKKTISNQKSLWLHKTSDLNKKLASKKGLLMNRGCRIYHKVDSFIKIQGLEEETLLSQHNFIMRGRSLKRLTTVRWNRSRKAFISQNRTIHNMIKQYHGIKHKIYLCQNKPKSSLLHILRPKAHSKFKKSW